MPKRKIRTFRSRNDENCSFLGPDPSEDAVDKGGQRTVSEVTKHDDTCAGFFGRLGCLLPAASSPDTGHSVHPVLRGYCYRSDAHPVLYQTDRGKTTATTKVQSRIPPARRLERTQSTFPYELCLADPREDHFKQCGPIARLPGGPFAAHGSEDECRLRTVDFLEMSLPRSVGPKDNQTGHQCVLQTDL